jgi:hypothetical protein
MSKVHIDITRTSAGLSVDGLAFSHPLLAEAIVAERGRGLRREGNCVDFTLSRGSRALIALCLQQAIIQNTSASAAQSNQQETAKLSGERGSLAASLDYAISKRSAWVTQCFGTDRRGHPLLARLLQRRNTNLKRPGPVVLEFPDISSPKIQVRINRQVCSDIASLTEAYSFVTAAEIRPTPLSCSKVTIESALSSYKERTSPLIEDTRFLNILTKRFEQELSTCLDSINQYNSTSYERTCKNVLNAPGVVKLSGTCAQALSKINPLTDFKSQISARALGDIESYDSIKKHEWSVAVTPAQTSALAAFTYLRDVLAIPIDLQIPFHHALSATKQVVSDSFTIPPDLIVLPIAEAAHVLSLGNKVKYEPFLIVPGVSHQVIGNVDSSDLAHGAPIAISGADYSMTRYVKENLLDSRHKLLTSERNQLEPSQVFTATVAADLEPTLLWFPYWNITSDLLADKCSALLPKAINTESILFLRRDTAVEHSGLISTLKLALLYSLRHLRSSQELQKLVVSRILSSKKYLTQLGNSSGVAELSFGQADKISRSLRYNS